MDLYGFEVDYFLINDGIVAAYSRYYDRGALKHLHRIRDFTT